MSAEQEEDFQKKQLVKNLRTKEANLLREIKTLQDPALPNSPAAYNLVGGVNSNSANDDGVQQQLHEKQKRLLEIANELAQTQRMIKALTENAPVVLL